MLNRSTTLFAVQSHQHNPTRVPMGKFSYGRNYTQNYVKYANSGWGMGTYTARKDRRFFPAMFNRPKQTQADISDATRPISVATKTLSPHFRPFALADGGVLFIHPSTKEVLTWTHDVLGKEQKESGLGSVHDQTRSKIQALIADNTIEHVSVAQWRQMHIQRLVRNALRRPAARSPDIRADAHSGLHSKTALAEWDEGRLES